MVLPATLMPQGNAGLALTALGFVLYAVSAMVLMIAFLRMNKKAAPRFSYSSLVRPEETPAYRRWTRDMRISMLFLVAGCVVGILPHFAAQKSLWAALLVVYAVGQLLALAKAMSQVEGPPTNLQSAS